MPMPPPALTIGPPTGNFTVRKPMMPADTPPIPKANNVASKGVTPTDKRKTSDLIVN